MSGASLAFQFDRLFAESNRFVEISLGVGDQPGQLIVEVRLVGIFVDPIAAELDASWRSVPASFVAGRESDRANDRGRSRRRPCSGFFLDRLFQQFALLDEILLLAGSRRPDRNRSARGTLLVESHVRLGRGGQFSDCCPAVEAALHQLRPLRASRERSCRLSARPKPGLERDSRTSSGVPFMR